MGRAPTRVAALIHTVRTRVSNAFEVQVQSFQEHFEVKASKNILSMQHAASARSPTYRHTAAPHEVPLLRPGQVLRQQSS